MAYFLEGLYARASLIGPENLALLASFGEPNPMVTEKWPQEGMVKILSFVDREKTKIEATFRKEAEGRGVRVIRTAEHFLEFIARDSGKEIAMRMILED